MENPVSDGKLVEATRHPQFVLHEVFYKPSFFKSKLASLIPNPNEVSSRYVQLLEGNHFVEFQGGMGRVIKMKDTKLDRFVAVKKSLYSSKEAYDEAKDLASLNHENILKVHDLAISSPDQNGEVDLYFVSEWVDGVKLSEAERDLKYKDAVKLLKQICSAIEYVGDQNKVHSDLKDDNILVNKMGNAVVLDFGLLKKLRGGKAVAGMGTPYWAPPEQATYGEVLPSTDSYYLGGLTIKVLFSDSSLSASLEQTRESLLNDSNLVLTPRSQFRRVFEKHPEVVKEFTSCLRKSQQPIPKNRYQSAKEFNKVLLPLFTRVK